MDKPVPEKSKSIVSCNSPPFYKPKSTMVISSKVTRTSLSRTPRANSTTSTTGTARRPPLMRWARRRPSACSSRIGCLWGVGTIWSCRMRRRSCSGLTGSCLSIFLAAPNLASPTTSPNSPSTASCSSKERRTPASTTSPWRMTRSMRVTCSFWTSVTSSTTGPASSPTTMSG